MRWILLDPEPALKVAGLPSSGRVSLLQPGGEEPLRGPPALQSRTPAAARCRVIEDFPSIPDATLELRLPEQVVKVRTIPGGEVLPVVREGNLLKVAVPAFSMHTGIVLEY